MSTQQLVLYAYVYKTNCCVDTLNTEGTRGPVSWLIRVRTRRDYAQQAKLCSELQLARATVLRSVGQIAPVCGTIPLSVKLSSATMTGCTVDLADSRPCLASRLASSDLTLHW